MTSKTTQEGMTQRTMHHFCKHQDCMAFDPLKFRPNKNAYRDMAFMKDKGVFPYRTIDENETIRQKISTFREFNRYIDRMKYRKAVGKDGTPADLIKRSQEAFKKRCWILINMILT